MYPDYKTGLRKIRRARRRLRITTVVWFASFSLSFLAVDVLNFGIEWLAVTLFFAGFLAVVITSLMISFERCPRCRKHFCRMRFVDNLLIRHCINCRLPIKLHWEPTPDQTGRVVEWIAQPTPKGPLPDAGLFCPNCRYSLTGLPGDQCPECGNTFDVLAFAEEIMIRGDEESLD